MQLLKLTRLPLFVITTFLVLSVVAIPSVSAQSCPAADADDGSSDGVITIDDGLTTTWTDTDGTAFDCATLSITVTNSSTLHIDKDSTAGYLGQINAINIKFTIAIPCLNPTISSSLLSSFILKKSKVSIVIFYYRCYKSFIKLIKFIYK